jgi:hypothetical protein
LDTTAVDFSALLLGIGASGIITAALAWASRREGTARLWITAAALTVLLVAIGFVDLMRERPRETHIATLLVGIPIPVLGAVGLYYAMRRVRPWVRWSVIFLAGFVLLFLGLLIGAAIMPRFLGA